MENNDRYIFPAQPKIIFMGTPEFSVPSLKAMIDHGHNIQAVITQPDRPKGRGKKMAPSPIKQVAIQNRLEVLQPEKASDEQFCDLIRVKAPDILIVVAFGQLLKKNLLTIPRWGVLNIHASILPKYRGAAPIHWAILNNEPTTGLTAMRMDEGLDTGPTLLKEVVPIGTDETAGELHDRLARLSRDFLLKTLEGLAKNQLTEKPQDHAIASFAPKIDRSMSLINWNQPAQTVSALIRALDPWPGAFTTLKGKEIKLFSSTVISEERLNTKPGRVLGHAEGELEVETSNGAVQIRELQLPGRKRLAASEFLRGFSLDKGTILE
jgi:methionyl-tRNA formyltransferase